MDLDKLYVEDSIQSSKFSSLDRAFMLQPINNNILNNTHDERMNNYKNETDKYTNIKHHEFKSQD